MRLTAAAPFLLAIALVTPGCIGMDEEDDLLEQEEDALDEEDDLEVPDDAELESLSCKSARVTKRNGKTVYLKICRTVGTARREAWVVDECAGGTSWRILRSGSVVKSGFQSHCRGSSVYVTTVNATLTLQAQVTDGGWSGISY